MPRRHPDARHYDKRLMERYVTRGVITQADVDKRLDALDDKADQAENIAELVYAGSDSQADEGPADGSDQ